MQSLGFKLLFLFSLVCCVQANGQNKVDSLENLLPQTEGNEKIDLLILLAKSTGRMDPAKSEQFAIAAFALAETAGYEKAMVSGLTITAILASRSGNFPRAEEHSLKAIEIAKQASLLEDLASAQLVLGNLYVRQEEYAKALEVYLTGLPIAEQVEHKHLIFNYLMNIGVIKEEINELDEAEQYFL